MKKHSVQPTVFSCVDSAYGRWAGSIRVGHTERVSEAPSEVGDGNGTIGPNYPSIFHQLCSSGSGSAGAADDKIDKVQPKLKH